MSCDLNLLPYRDTEGVCDACGKALTGRQKRWCSRECSFTEWPQHDWDSARKAAKRRDGNRCVKCGAADSVDHLFRSQLQVNHIVPRVGRGYGWGCHNHLENLETLCHDCHVKVTNQQRAERKAAMTDSHSHDHWLTLTGALACACGDSRRPLPELQEQVDTEGE